MSCGRNTFSRETLEALMKLPAFRYMKAPVDTVAQLYEKYPDGNERGTFAFVFNEGTFYAYKPSTMTTAAQWISIASADIVDVVNEARVAAEEARIAAENANAAIEEIDGAYAKKSEVVFAKDVVDNLASSDAAKVLSANQGRVLNERKQDAKPNSTTPLINGLGRIDDIYIPEYMKGNNLFKGVIVSNGGLIVSGDAAYNGLLIGSIQVADVPAGHYFIVGAGVSITLGGFTATSGDWIISNQTQGWARIGDSAVTGVKGEAEANYRTGLVSLSLAEIVGQDAGDELEHLGRDLVDTYTGDGVLNVSAGQWLVSDIYALKADIQKMFTFVVDSQATCDIWASGTGHNFSSVLIKPGNYTIPNKGIMLNNSNYVRAMSGAEFTYNGTGLTPAFYFDEDIYGDRNAYASTSYENLRVRLTSTGAYGFSKCFNLKSCVVINSNKNTQGFYKCTNLLNCKCESTVGGATSGSTGFNICKNLYNCVASKLSTGTLTGFANCDYLSNCYAYISNVISTGLQEDIYIYYRCNYLVNCECDIYTSNLPDVRATGFVDCTKLSQCVSRENNTQLADTGVGFSDCRSMQNCRSEYHISARKYSRCYANATGTSYPAADTPNGGFNS